MRTGYAFAERCRFLREMFAARQGCMKQMRIDIEILTDADIGGRRRGYFPKPSASARTFGHRNEVRPPSCGEIWSSGAFGAAQRAATCLNRCGNQTVAVSHSRLRSRTG